MTTLPNLKTFSKYTQSMLDDIALNKSAIVYTGPVTGRVDNLSVSDYQLKFIPLPEGYLVVLKALSPRASAIVRTGKRKYFEYLGFSVLDARKLSACPLPYRQELAPILAECVHKIGRHKTFCALLNVEAVSDPVDGIKHTSLPQSVKQLSASRLISLLGFATILQ